jgi:hypothetical protein
MESKNLTDEMLFRQVKSAIAGHNFKLARKTLEQHLDDAQDNPRIWELYGNVLKKLGKTDKARAAFLRRDELRRDDLAFERLADDYVGDVDLEYLDDHQQFFTHEQYVYGMEDSACNNTEKRSIYQGGKFGSVLSLDDKLSDSQVSKSDELPSPLGVEKSFPDFQRETVSVDTSAGEEIISENIIEEEVHVLPYVDFWDSTTAITASDQSDLSIFADDAYSFDPDELIEDSCSEDDAFSITERITIEQRALQLAAAFINRHDWSNNTLDMLINIFSVKAYGPVVKFLNHYADAGMRPDELKLAKNMRDAWQQLPKYWITFYRNGESAASYYNFSWSQSLRFVTLISHCQNGTLDEDILLENLEIMYDRWFNSASLSKSYRSFSKYINAAMDQIEEDGLLFEYQAGFGSLREARDLHFSDLGDIDLFDQQLVSDLEFYGYSLDRSEFRPIRVCEDVIYDYAHYNQHRILLTETNNKEDKNE